jgi:hypothetical protein
MGGCHLIDIMRESYCTKKPHESEPVDMDVSLIMPRATGHRQPGRT